jgi:hypothetical protein
METGRRLRGFSVGPDLAAVAAKRRDAGSGRTYRTARAKVAIGHERGRSTITAARRSPFCATTRLVLRFGLDAQIRWFGVAEAGRRLQGGCPGRTAVWALPAQADPLGFSVDAAMVAEQVGRRREGAGFPASATR